MLKRVVFILLKIDCMAKSDKTRNPISLSCKLYILVSVFETLKGLILSLKLCWMDT